MKLGWRQLIFPVAAITLVLVGVTLAGSRTQMSARSSAPSFRHSNEQTGPGGALSIRGSQRFAMASGQAGAAEKSLLAEQAFKNVQALRGIPVDDFMATMGIMTSSLAFCCADCHPNAGTDKIDWAADNPRKVTARKMVLMVQEINKTNFGGRQVVTCFTCHRNRDRPLTTPTMAMLYGTPPDEPDDYIVNAKIPGMPTADQIFAKYVDALGGAQRVSGITSYSAKGKSAGFGGFGNEAVVTIYAQAPDKRATIIEFPNAPGRDAAVRTFDGRAGYMKTPMSVLGEYALGGSELDGARLDGQLSFPAQTRTALRNWRVTETSIDDLPEPAGAQQSAGASAERATSRSVYAVQGDGPRGMFATLYFDRDSGLLVRLLRYTPSPIGRVPTQVDYADYRDVGGAKFPFRFTFAWLNGRDAIQLTELQKNVPIEPAKFGRTVPAK